jgi:exosome complex exonuclease RRP6
MHGADWDIGWLQRILGCTSSICSILDVPHVPCDLLRWNAFLLHHYVGIDAEKRHQLSDWRQRPQ